MATQTQHFNLTKPDWEDRASISVLNANTDIIDAQMYDNEQSAANAIGNMAAEYDDTATYEVGDFCIYSEVLYKCVTAVSVPEAFDSTKWTQTKAAENFGSGGGGGSSTLASLTDVDLTSPTDGQALVYDATNQKWVNGGVIGSGGGSAKYSETVLWSGTQAGLGSIQLSESVKNFDQILILWNANVNSDAYAKYSYLVAVSDIDYTRIYQYQLLGTLVNANYSSYASLHFSDGTHLTIDEYSNGSNSNLRILKVIGIRWETMQTALIYSEEEREVGVWIDGKPLYQKTINFGTLPNNTSKSVAHGISNIDYVPYIGGVAKSSSGGIPISFAHRRNINNQIQIGYDATNINIITATDQTNYTICFITIRYTKTTDTAGSGTWTTTGEYAHHYSTTEQVVGTWIDGKPVYEKTVIVDNIPSADWTGHSIGVNDADIIDVSGYIESDNHVKWTINYYYNTNTMFNIYISSNSFVCYWKYSSSTYSKAVLTFKYTKTTD